MTWEVIHGDCLEVMPTLEGPFDAIITDLPYGTTACKWDSVIPFEPMWEQVKRLLKPRGAFVTTASQPFTSALIMSNVGWFKYCLYWDKVRGSNFATVAIRPFNNIEEIPVFYDMQCTYNPQMWESTPYHQKQGYVGESKQTGLNRDNVISISTGERYPLSIVKISKETGLHPTQKPVALYEYLIRTYTNEGDTVLDIATGSGTTGVACIRTGRHFVGIEKEAEYCDIARRRIAEEEAKPVQEALL